MNNVSTRSSQCACQNRLPAKPASVVTVFCRASAKNLASSLVGVFSANGLRLWGVGIWLGLGLGFDLAGQGAQAAEVASAEIVARDGRLFPERLEVPAGVKLKLTLRNEGKTPVEIENLELRVEKLLAPDAAAVVTIQPLRPGSYTFIDEFHAETGKMLLVAK